jgi:hypothetical protein
VAIVACSSTSDQTTDAGIDASGSMLEASVCVEDAGLGSFYSTLEAGATDPRCPSQWADLTDSSGIPVMCTVNGLICVYPQGQAECAPDGPPLKWWQGGLSQGCTELPPALCQPCTAPGSVCGYISGPPNGNTSFVTNLCCNGNSHLWEVSPSDGCPNGNVCGTIQASDYDQTCTKDADCTSVTDGNLCTIGCTNCPNATINMNALSQYSADFSKKLSGPRDCPCPLGPAPVCNSGTCGFAP